MTKGVYIIAEAGVNHNGKRDLAFELIDAAANAGVDAVKFQTFNAEELATITAPKAAYQTQTTDAKESQLEMLKKLELPKNWHVDLKNYALHKGIEFLSTAFDVGSLMFLTEMGVPLLKIPSGELTNGPLLWRFARTRLPLILSTGMANLGEVEQGLAVIAHALNSNTEPSSIADVWLGWSKSDWRDSLHGHVTLLHCTSQYPTPLDEVNLRAIDTLVSAFGLDVGYSDHTEGIIVPIAAVARGAKVIEKHFTLDRTLPGPDHRMSVEPHELKQMVCAIRMLESALGDGFKAPQLSELETRTAARQQVVARRDIAQGATLVREDLTTARSGFGLPPIALWSLVGQSVDRSYLAGEVIVT